MAGTGSVLSRLLEAASADPAAPALIDGARVVGYGELLDAARGVAADIPADAGRLIGIRMGRGWAAVAAMIGVLSTGRAYVPVDPAYPEPRQRYIEADARLGHVVEDGPDGPRVLRLGGDPGHEVPDNAMYVIYTSGSTGAPKGVVVTQDNVTSLLDAATADVRIRPGRRWSIFHSLSFDFSVWEVWGALLSGGCGVLVDRETALDPQLFGELLRDAHVNVLSIVPSAFAGLVRAAAKSGLRLPDLGTVVFGGEAVRLGDVAQWWQAGVAPECAMINMYGITETTVHVTACRLTPDALASATPGRTPIGRPLSNATVRVSRDGGATVCADGEPGEMIVLGAGVSEGYLDRPGLTAERFPVLDGQRAYRSGDWGVRTPDGELCYVGRIDNQVKIRGHRIELGEIEGILEQHDDIAAAACVIHRADGRPERLVAYVVGRAVAPEPRALRGWMATRVPAHLVPTRIVPLEELPMTAHGKVDRAALSERAAEQFEAAA
ncbi:amino acid adenylation domain-containing protein [Actinospica sp. MGRD01-02]|uniref:Amino acid adenylation domain-containing protein n=1 Tax=Actinospica acidithermotolerans TaxID=2828514 RepID=A0A941E8G0_9ACTN|nr:amino acid adenylation domain-containing protein [Actinospica acidithermotolerans]MBR7825727.1 amino acid adenylation domain-containing protein [Actinospica acidithermotolerans]